MTQQVKLQQIVAELLDAYRENPDVRLTTDRLLDAATVAMAIATPGLWREVDHGA